MAEARLQRAFLPFDSRLALLRQFNNQCTKFALRILEAQWLSLVTFQTQLSIHVLQLCFRCEKTSTADYGYVGYVTYIYI